MLTLFVLVFQRKRPDAKPRIEAEEQPEAEPVYDDDPEYPDLSKFSDVVFETQSERGAKFFQTNELMVLRLLAYIVVATCGFLLASAVLSLIRVARIRRIKQRYMMDESIQNYI